MRLDELLATLGSPTRALGPHRRRAPRRSGDASRSSRSPTTRPAAEPGTLFCCVPGRQTDGHDHAAAAVAAGAVALLAERRLDLPVPQLLVSSVRAAMGLVASGLPRRPVPARSRSSASPAPTARRPCATWSPRSSRPPGRPSGVIGTLSGTRTTPEAPELQARLASFARAGAAVAMEVSSHALVQHRVDGTRFAVAGFTNLSQDHLDYHGTMEAYFDAKARLFEPGRADRAVVCLDDPHGRLLRDAAQIPTVGYRATDASAVEVAPSGTTFTWRGVRMQTSLVGRFNLLERARGGHDHRRARGRARRHREGPRPRVAGAGPLRAGRRRPAVPRGGRLRPHPGRARPVLAAARELAGGGRVVVVFGCGGDRDPSKRPRMGAAASQGADLVVVTSDNPRFEDPDAIIEEVLTGFGHDDAAARRARPPPGDRRGAGRWPSAGDVVVVAGKGHETTQVIGDSEEPFDDRAGRPGGVGGSRARRRTRKVIALLLAGGLALAASLLGTRYLIDWLHRHRIGQPIHEDVPEGHKVKAGTPTMGGLGIVVAAVVGYVVAHVRSGLVFTRSGSARARADRRRRHRRRARRLDQGQPGAQPRAHQAGQVARPARRRDRASPSSA